MNKKDKLRLIFCLFFSLLVFSLVPSEIFTYQWPVSPFAGPHPIHGTLGEWKGTRLHRGVDIGRGVGTPVYPSVTGIITTINREDNYVIAGEFKYIHIIPADGLTEDHQAIAGQTLLGTIAPGAHPHLHLEEDAGALNPLRPDGLDNYADTANPTVSTVEFFYDKTADATSKSSQTQLTGVIFGKIDILSRAKDSQSNGSNTVSVYKIGYEVKNDDGTTVLEPTYNIQFDDVTNWHRGLVYANFGTRQSDESNYYYWVTNSLTEDRYWNNQIKTRSGLERE